MLMSASGIVGKIEVKLRQQQGISRSRTVCDLVTRLMK